MSGYRPERGLSPSGRTKSKNMAMSRDFGSMVSPFNTRSSLADVEVKLITCRHSARSGLVPIISMRQLVKASRPITHSLSLPLRPSALPTRTVHEAFEHLFRLSILLSRTLSLIYGPRGVKDTSNKDVLELLGDVKEWKRNLPDGLRLTNVCRSTEAGKHVPLHRVDRACIRFG
jgi:hypothetical protein